MAQKIAFFTELFKLDEDEEETEDPEDAAVILRQFKPLPKSLQSEERGLLGCKTSSLLSNASAVQASSSSNQSPSEPLRRSSRVNISSSSYPVKMVKLAKVTPKKKTSRRKGSEPLKSLPDSQQIFKGLEFYFIPNNDISPARRFRIKKAVERGALWVREWRTDVTHIIADKTLTYKDIMSFLKLSSIPENVALVTEDYPAACISHQLVLNPNQFRYYVEGFEQPLRIEKTLRTEGVSSPISLNEKTISCNGITESSKEPGRAENAFCAISVMANPTVPEALGQGVLTEPDFESLNGSSQHAPSSGTGESAGTESPAGSNIMIPKVPGQTGRDALNEAIEEVAAFKDLPLDYDEDLDLTETVVDESDDEHNQNGEPEVHSKRRKTNKDQPWQQNFSCMHKHDGKDKGQNPNSRTIEVLQKMLEYYDRTDDHWRTLAYRKAISALRKHSTKVMTEEQASNIPFIGQRLAAKIEEIVQTDRLRRLDNASLEPNDLTLQKFLKIYGVGLAQATKWINQGHRTLKDLVSKAHLTKNQLIGIEHYDDFQTRIPRAEVEAHGEFVRSVIHQVDPTIQVTIGGSYRRGATDSGDVDFIITKPNSVMGILRNIVFESVLPMLQERGYVKASLAISSKDDGSKWHGAAALPPNSGSGSGSDSDGIATPVWRRIDFLLVPFAEMGAALLYFTGNDIFNRSIRLLARKKGMRLNQHGLWRDVMGEQRSGGGVGIWGARVEGGTGGETGGETGGGGGGGIWNGNTRSTRTQGMLIESRSEERIFEVLGVPFRPPEHRIC